MNDLENRIAEVGPWYHRVNLGGGTWTKSSGFNPESKWSVIKKYLPKNMSGMRTLEIGCSSAYYSIKMAQRGAECDAFDHLQSAIKQANFLADHFRVRVNARVRTIYDLLQYRKNRYDYIIFLGVLYHNRYPMLVLDMLSDLNFRHMLFQTTTTDNTNARKYTGFIENQKDPIFLKPDFPKLWFVENRIRQDATSWWMFNKSSAEAMLRACGMKDIYNIQGEFWKCEKGDKSVIGEVEYLDCITGIVKSMSNSLEERNDEIVQKLNVYLQQIEDKLVSHGKEIPEKMLDSKDDRNVEIHRKLHDLLQQLEYKLAGLSEK